MAQPARSSAPQPIAGSAERTMPSVHVERRRERRQVVEAGVGVGRQQHPVGAGARDVDEALVAGPPVDGARGQCGEAVEDAVLGQPEPGQQVPPLAPARDWKIV